MKGLYVITVYIGAGMALVFYSIMNITNKFFSKDILKIVGHKRYKFSKLLCT